MDKITDLQELLKHELKDLYSAEVQLLDALPKMAEKATDPELKKAFTDHLKVTQQHQKRLESIQAFFNMEKVKETKGFFANLFKSKEGEEHCKAMEGLIKEANSLMSEDMVPEVMDAAIIAAAQKVEHYEISSYGTARAYATQLGFKRVYDLLTETLTEEYAADDSLTALAVGNVNILAEEGGKETPVAAGAKKPKDNKADTDTDKAVAVSGSAKKSPVSTPKEKAPVSANGTGAAKNKKAVAPAKKSNSANKLVKKVASSTAPKKAAKKTTKKRSSVK